MTAILNYLAKLIYKSFSTRENRHRGGTSESNIGENMENNIKTLLLLVGLDRLLIFIGNLIGGRKA